MRRDDRLLDDQATLRLRRVHERVVGRDAGLSRVHENSPQMIALTRWGKFVNAGQTCVAPDYAFVHASKAEAFLDASRRMLSSFYGATEEARQASLDFCRVIDARNWTRVDWSHRAGGQSRRNDRDRRPIGSRRALHRADDPVRTSPPTRRSCRTRSSGRCYPCSTYQSREEIFEFLHARPKPLAMYVFSKDERQVAEFIARTSAGGTVINNCLVHILNPDLPFGGAGESGFGNYHGHFGFQTFSHARAVTVQRRSALLGLFQPPYARLKTGWLGSIVKLARRLRD